MINYKIFKLKTISITYKFENKNNLQHIHFELYFIICLNIIWFSQYLFIAWACLRLEFSNLSRHSHCILIPWLLVSSNLRSAQSFVKEYVRLKARLPDLKRITIGHLSKCAEAKLFMRDCGPHKLKYLNFNWSIGQENLNMDE